MPRWWTRWKASCNEIPACCLHLYRYIYMNHLIMEWKEGPTYLPTWLQIPLWTLQLVSQQLWNSQTAETFNHHNTWPSRTPISKTMQVFRIPLESLCVLVPFSCISLIYSSPWGHKVSGAHLISNHIAERFCFFVHCKFQLDAFSFCSRILWFIVWYTNNMKPTNTGAKVTIKFLTGFFLFHSKRHLHALQNLL